jgi:hypothetical protein
MSRNKKEFHARCGVFFAPKNKLFEWEVLRKVRIPSALAWAGTSLLAAGLFILSFFLILDFYFFNQAGMAHAL